jgi:hypothetical protein
MTICIHTPQERQVLCPCPLCQAEELQAEIERLKSESFEHKKLAIQYAASDKFWTDLAVARNKTIGRLGEENAQLRGNLSLAEEGLANYQQETQELKRALNFWLPMIPDDAPLDENACLSRIEQDARLLFKYDGEADEQCAAELGWISLHPPQKEDPGA